MEGEADFTLEEVVENLGLRPLVEGGWGRPMAGADAAARGEAVGAYRLLTPEAMGWGLGGAMLLSFGIECLFRLIDWVVLGGKRLRQSRPIEERDLKGL